MKTITIADIIRVLRSHEQDWEDDEHSGTIVPKSYNSIAKNIITLIKMQNEYQTDKERAKHKGQGYSRNARHEQNDLC